MRQGQQYVISSYPPQLQFHHALFWQVHSFLPFFFEHFIIFFVDVQNFAQLFYCDCLKFITKPFLQNWFKFFLLVFCGEVIEKLEFLDLEGFAFVQRFLNLLALLIS